MTNMLRRLQPADGPDTVGAAARPALARFHWRDYTVYIAFAIVFVVFAIALSDDGFLSSNNLTNIIAQTAPISIMAVACLLYTSPSPRDGLLSRMPSSA